MAANHESRITNHGGLVVDGGVPEIRNSLFVILPVLLALLLSACDPSVCTECRGAGRVDCTLCEAGQEDCPSCADGQDMAGPCRFCKARGTRFHELCEGKGTRTCDRCAGKGRR